MGKGQPVFSFHPHLRETPWIPLVFVQILGIWQKLGTIHEKAFSLSFEIRVPFSASFLAV